MFLRSLALRKIGRCPAGHFITINFQRPPETTHPRGSYFRRCTLRQTVRPKGMENEEVFSRSAFSSPSASIHSTNILPRISCHVNANYLNFHSPNKKALGFESEGPFSSLPSTICLTDSVSDASSRPGPCPSIPAAERPERERRFHR